MRKILLILFVFIFCLSVEANELKNVGYKNLKEGAFLSDCYGYWTTKVNKKNDEYLIKRCNELDTVLYSPDEDIVYFLQTHYEFLHKGSLIGYSNSDLKFYEFEIVDSKLQKRELIPDEVKALFPKYTVIKLSDFSMSTNCLKIKKNKRHLKLIVLNDTNYNLEDYEFTSNNVDFNRFYLKGFLDITKKGMVHLAKTGENTQNCPWFVLLIR